MSVSVPSEEDAQSTTNSPCSVLPLEGPPAHARATSFSISEPAAAAARVKRDASTTERVVIVAAEARANKPTTRTTKASRTSTTVKPLLRAATDPSPGNPFAHTPATYGDVREVYHQTNASRGFLLRAETNRTLIVWILGVGSDDHELGELPYVVHLAAPSVSAGLGGVAEPMKMAQVWGVPV